jgi:hypothetical protein
VPPIKSLGLLAFSAVNEREKIANTVFSRTPAYGEVRPSLFRLNTLPIMSWAENAVIAHVRPLMKG